MCTVIAYTAYHTGKYSILYYVCMNINYIYCLWYVGTCTCNKFTCCTYSTGELSEEQKAALTSYFPTAEIHMVQNAGHLIHSRQPEKFMEHVCWFIDSL